MDGDIENNSRPQPPRRNRVTVERGRLFQAALHATTSPERPSTNGPGNNSEKGALERNRHLAEPEGQGPEELGIPEATGGHLSEAFVGLDSEDDAVRRWARLTRIPRSLPAHVLQHRPEPLRPIHHLMLAHLHNLGHQDRRVGVDASQGLGSEPQPPTPASPL